MRDGKPTMECARRTSEPEHLATTRARTSRHAVSSHPSLRRYIHAEGYPAAEMKHGPIALIDQFMPGT